MTIDTLFDHAQNLIAPEVKVEHSLPLESMTNDWYELRNKLAEAFDLELLDITGPTYRFKFPGTAVIDCSQIKVVWGALPDEAAYHKLQAFLEIRLLDERTLQLKLYENLLGTQAEQEVYQRVLSQRMEALVLFLTNKARI